MHGRRSFTIFAILVAFVPAILAPSCPAVAADGESQPAAAEVTPDSWPRTDEIGGVKYSIYQPQLDSWDGHRLTARAAVSVARSGKKEPEFGLVEFTAETQVFKQSRTVEFRDIRVVKVSFPAATDNAASYKGGFQSMASGGPSTMSLDRLEAMLAIKGAKRKASRVEVKNDPPNFVFSTKKTVLVAIDGLPVWRPVEGTSLERVLNTRPLVLLDDRSGNYFIHLFDGFVTAKTLSGPWTAAQNVPDRWQQIAKELGEKKVVDLMEGAPDPDDPKKVPSLRNGVPSIVVATAPTELIVTDGEPDWAPLQGTMLLYVKNSTANVFKDLNDQQTYVLVTGRWFTAPGFSGPWKFVPGKDLPEDFSKIPDASPKENVKASIPGTPQAEAAVIPTYIPQTAVVNRSDTGFSPVIDGDPELKPVPDTSLKYVFNSPTPILMVSATQWYALQNGVWFTSSSVRGPWIVAASVPASIYSIPPSSPLYYVTYVKIYDVTPQTVVVGYTPGYLGTLVTPERTVVYGTGYSYVTYVGTTVWYPPPVTYGYGAAVTWTPWTGWAVGFGFGWAMGAMYGSGCCWGYACAPYWGPMPYSPYAGVAYGRYGGAAAWGPGGWAATSGNVYSHWGSTSVVSRSSAGYNAWTGNAWSSRVGTSYNSTTGRISAGQRASLSNVYTGNYAYGQRGATYNPATGVSARGGSVRYSDQRLPVCCWMQACPSTGRSLFSPCRW